MLWNPSSTGRKLPDVTVIPGISIQSYVWCPNSGIPTCNSEKQGYSTRDLEYDLVYVNGDNNLENLGRPDQTWKVGLIEEEFHRFMFNVKDV